jgi:retron-type reverse transcriptase
MVQLRRSKIKKRKRVAREKFIPPDGLTIGQMTAKVAELQSELAVEVRNGNIRAQKGLISKMSRSRVCLAYAVYRTISATGARTRGINDIPRPISQSAYQEIGYQLWDIIKSPQDYKATPLARVYTPKPKGGLRPLSVPTYIDRALQHLFNLILDVYQENSADPRSYGFRKFRSPQWGAKAIILDFWNRKTMGPPKFCIQLDIEKCFDRISHQFILDHVARINGIDVIPKNIMNQWLKSGFFDIRGTLNPEGLLQPTTEGVPQGGPISPTITNMVLNGIEKAIDLSRFQDASPSNRRLLNPNDKFVFKHKEFWRKYYVTGCDDTLQVQQKLAAQEPGYKFPSVAGYLIRGDRKTRLGWQLIGQERYSPIPDPRKTYFRLHRFADDIVVFVYTNDAISVVLPQLQEFLDPRGLKLSAIKTKIVNLENKPFDFVGFQFKSLRRSGSDKIYCYPPKGALNKIIDTLKTIFPSKANYYRKDWKWYKTPLISPVSAIRKANSVIYGWVNFYRTGNSKSCFSYLKFRLFHIVRRYFYYFHSRSMQFRSPKKHLKTYSLYNHIWSKYLLQRVNRSPWWGIHQKYSPNKGRYKDKPLMLADPSTIRIMTPSIILNKSAYFPPERQALLGKAVEFKWGLRAKLLRKARGVCKLCFCNLLDEETSSQIHHILPIKSGGDNNESNLCIICRDCHANVTRAVTTRDLPMIRIFISAGVLSSKMLSSS